MLLVVKYNQSVSSLFSLSGCKSSPDSCVAPLLLSEAESVEPAAVNVPRFLALEILSLLGVPLWLTFNDIPFELFATLIKYTPAGASFTVALPVPDATLQPVQTPSVV